VIFPLIAHLGFAARLGDHHLVNELSPPRQQPSQFLSPRRLFHRAR
jgi:hypothetical protein